MTIAPNAVPVIPRGVRLHHDKVRDAWVLLAPERTIALDPVGHAILSRIDGKRDFQSLTADLAQAYNAPISDIQADSAEFITSLANSRILELKC